MGIETPLAGASTFTQPDMFSTAIKTFSTLFILLAVILFGLYLVKRFWPKGAGLMGGDQWIKVITTSYLAPKKMISLVEVAGEILVLGHTDTQITMLSKVADQQTIHHLKSSQKGKGMGSPFYQQLKDLVNKRGGERDQSGEMINKITNNLYENNETIEKIGTSGIKP
jgi:flagellar protein FliO/FliZ